MTEKRPIHLHVPDIPARPSAEPYVVEGDYSAIRDALYEAQGKKPVCFFAQTIRSSLWSLDACETNVEIVIRPRYRGDAHHHRITIHDPQHFGLKVGESVGEEQQTEDD